VVEDPEDATKGRRYHTCVLDYASSHGGSILACMAAGILFCIVSH
jgi:hypothetical protein